MPGIIDGLKNIYNGLRVLAAGPGSDNELTERYERLSQYERGEHRRSLKTRVGEPNFNVVLNFAGLIVDRTISMLLGNGIKFSFGYPKMAGQDQSGKAVELPSEQEQLLLDTWDANRQQIFLHWLAYYGAVYGTMYVKLQPEGRESRREPGRMLTRLIAQNPRWMTIETDPEDFERVLSYRLQFKYTQTLDSGQTEEIARLETVSREMAEEQIQVVVNKDTGETKPATRMSETGNWVIRNYVSSRLTGGKWQQMGEDVQWAYPFPPIIHWQNLPDPENCYGSSDLEDVISSEKHTGIQDDVNFTVSNILKVITFFAHPMRWARGLSGSNVIEVGSEKILNIVGSDSMVAQLEMTGDLASSRAFANDLRQAMFDISRTVDLSSVADKLGSLTNFGLRVLFWDMLNKNATKQELYGDALVELNHRLLVLAGYQGAAADGGHVVWPDPLPVNRTEIVTTEVAAVAAGIESKETAAENLGLDWAQEQERMAASTVATSNIGEQLLTAFSRGQ